MSYTINPNAKNRWARNAENTMDLSLETDASSVYLDNGRTLEQELGEGSMVSNVATVDTSMSKVIDGTLDGAYESGVMYGRSLVNLFDKTKIQPHSGYSIGEDNTITYLSYQGFGKGVKLNCLKPNTKYALFFNVLSTSLDPDVPYRINDDGTNYGINIFGNKQDAPSSGYHSFVTGDNVDNVQFRFYTNKKNEGYKLTLPVILEYQQGMENWDIPYFTGICDSKMPILRNVGKNLFDGSYEQDKFINEYGTISDSADWCATDFIRVRPNTTYTQNKNIPSSIVYFCFYNEDKQLISTTQPINYNRTFTTPNNCHFIRTSWKYSIDGFDFQFEEGTETTTYEDHKTNILRTSEEVVLREVNGVQDTYNPLTGEYVRRISEVVFDGSSDEDWSVNKNIAGGKQFVYNASLGAKSGNTTVISDKLPSIVDANESHVENIWIYNGTTIVIHKNLQDANELKTWLSQNPITVQYELAEPITTIVESLTTPFAYQNGHIILESGYEGQSLLPILEYSTVVNKTGLVENVAKTIQRQEKQLTMLEQMLIQNIINLDYNNTLLALKNEMEEML